MMTLCKDFIIWEDSIGWIFIEFVQLEQVMEDIWLIGYKVIQMLLNV